MNAEEVVRIGPHTLGLETRIPGQRLKALDTVFVGAFGVYGFPFDEGKALACHPDTLVRVADEMHLDPALGGIEVGQVPKAFQVEIRPKLTINAP